MKKILMLSALFLFIFFATTYDLFSQDFDQNTYFRLTTRWQGEDKSLEVVNDGLNDKIRLFNTGKYTGQAWKITPLGDGCYRLTNKWLGNDKSLDIMNDGDHNVPMLYNTGKFSGQAWKITPIEDGYYRLTTLFQGDGMSLDVVNDGENNKLRLAAKGKYYGQYWLIKPAGETTELSPFVKPEDSAPFGMNLNPTYRVVVSPNEREMIFPNHGSDWKLEYKFLVPPVPTAQWDGSRQVVYTFGEVVFDSYGSSGQYKISDYQFNQIVPEVMIGTCLDESNNYIPSFHLHPHWVLQAQYFWRNTDQTDYALCGKFVEVSPNDELTSEISYESSTGKIYVSISAPSGKSSITIDRPFPNDKSLFTDWKDFFTRAEQKSNTPGIYGMADLNVEAHNLNEETICSILPFHVNSVSIPGIPWQQGNFRVFPEGNYRCTDGKRLAELHYGN